MPTPLRLMLLCALPFASGAAKLATAPASLVFPLTNARFAITFLEETKKPVQFEVLSLIDGGTGLPIPLNPGKPVVTVTPLNVSTRIATFNVSVDKTLLTRSPFFAGVLAVYYDTSAGKESSTDTLEFQIVRDGFHPQTDKPGEATLTVLDPKVTATLSKDTKFSVCVAADKWGFELISVHVTDPFDQTGAIVAGKPIQLEKRPPRRVAAFRSACIHGTWQPQPPAAAGKVTASLVITYRAETAGAAHKRQTAQLEFTKAVYDATCGDKNETHFLRYRSNPFEVLWVGAEDTCTTSPPGARLPSENLPSTLAEGTPHPTDTQTAKLFANSAGSKIQYSVAIPPGVTYARGTVTLTNALGKDKVLNPVFRVKDVWWLRAIATLLAWGMAYLLYWLTGPFRTRLLHGAERGRLTAQVNSLLAANPFLVGDVSVRFTRELLADSAGFDRAGESARATEALQAAALRLQSLASVPPPATGTPQIRIVQPEKARSTEQLLTLSIEPASAVPAGSIVAWSISPPGPPFTKEGPDLVRIQHPFDQPDDYTVTVTWTGLAAPLVRVVAINPRPESNIFSILKNIEVVVGVAALILAALTAFVKTDTAEQWGTPSDYVSLVMAAFGATGGLQTIRMAMGLLRNGG